jgi:hypothetical protein
MSFDKTDRLPSRLDILIAACLSAGVTATDIYLSTKQGGWRALPPINDGVVYMVQAKSLFYGWQHDPIKVLELLLENRTPLWIGLLLLSLLVFGDGEWQFYVIRFGSIFGLLLLMGWIIRRRAGLTIALVCMGVTALLPTMSPVFRSGLEQVNNQMDTGIWALRDLRPDSLFAVLLMWAIAILVEHLPTVNRTTLLLSGTFIGLAILCKSSTMLAMFLIWGLAIALVYWLSPSENRIHAKQLFWLSLPPLILISPWVFAGGFKVAWDYIYITMTVNRKLWAHPDNPSLLQLFNFQWQYFKLHMGADSFVVLGLGTVAFGMQWLGKRVDPRSLIYLLLGGTYYLLVSLNPVGRANEFFAQPFIFLISIAAWVSLAPVLSWLNQKNRRIALLSAIGIYFLVMVSRGVSAYDQMLSWGRMELREKNVQTFTQIGLVLKELKPDECFIPLGIGMANTYVYYAINNHGEHPIVSFYYSNSSPQNTAIELAAKCRVVITYKDQAPEGWLAYLMYAFPESGKSATEAIKQWLSHNPQYKLVQEYPYVFTADASKDLRLSHSSILTIQVYRREKS